MSIVLLGSTSGSCTLQEQAVAGSTTLTLPTFDGTVGLLVSGTAVASTSGTSIDFTSIPAGVRRITVMFSGVSTNGTSNYLIQIGAGSITSSGYLTQAFSFTNNATTSSTAGFILTSLIGAADAQRGAITISLQNSSTNTWVDSGTLVDGTRGHFCAGVVPLSGTLDRVRITTVNGTDTFDAGSINILYE